MPAIISHYLLAERVYCALKDLRPQLKINHTAFVWGASGPDVLFCHSMFPFQKKRSLREYGTKMHNEPADVLLNYLVSYAGITRDDIAMSYALGFVTHYAFDSLAHPFVLYFSEQMAYRQKGKHESVCHNEIEANLDSLFLRMERKEKISRFRLSDAAPLDRRVNKGIAKALQGYFLYHYDKRVFESDFVQAQKDWHRGLALLNDRTGIKYRFVRSCENALGISPLGSTLFRRDYPDLQNDYANMKHKQWFSAVDGLEHTESFFDIADKAEDFSVELIADIRSGKQLSSQQCKYKFSGKGENDKN